MIAKVFQYGSPLKTQRLEEGHALNQLRLQNQFWNALVELDRDYRESRNIIYNESDDRIMLLNSYIELIDDRINEHRKDIKTRRKIERSGKASVEAINQKIGALKDEKKLVKEEIKELRDHRRDEISIKIKPLLHELDAQHKARVITQSNK